MASHAKAMQLDRISNLPIKVLHLILERLPLHDAARTSILSKTWRSVWELQNIVNLDKVVGNMPKIQVLRLDGLFLKCLGPGASVLKRLTRTMENLIFQQLFHFGFRDLGQIQSFFCLIRSSPNLQNLRIRLEPKVKSVNALTASRVEQYLQLPNFVDMILGQIETVDILGMMGSRSEVNFIKLLLASSPSLIWLKLSKSVTVTDPREELRILGEVTRRPRASTTAQIIWN